MPQPRISIQPVPLQAPQPAPWQSWHSTSISADGSVNGKNEGRKRTAVDGEKKRRAKCVSVALRSTNDTPSSMASPSICSKAGACDGSNASLR